MDKIIQKEIMATHGIDVPQGISLSSDAVERFDLEKTIKQLEKQNIQLPYIVKPYKEGSSLGVSVVFNHNDLHEAVRIACYIHAETPQAVLVEEKLEGMEFSCITLTNYKTGKLLPLPPGLLQVIIL